MCIREYKIQGTDGAAKFKLHCTKAISLYSDFCTVLFVLKFLITLTICITHISTMSTLAYFLNQRCVYFASLCVTLEVPIMKLNKLVLWFSTISDLACTTTADLVSLPKSWQD